MQPTLCRIFKSGHRLVETYRPTNYFLGECDFIQNNKKSLCGLFINASIDTGVIVSAGFLCNAIISVSMAIHESIQTGPPPPPAAIPYEEIQSNSPDYQHSIGDLGGYPEIYFFNNRTDNKTASLKCTLFSEKGIFIDSDNEFISHGARKIFSSRANNAYSIECIDWTSHPYDNYTMTRDDFQQISLDEKGRRVFNVTLGKPKF